MATEEQAKRARDLHQDRLALSGAHGLSVETLPKAESGAYGVVAWIDPAARKAASLPSSLQIKERGRTVKVPLVIRESKPFQLE